MSESATPLTAVAVHEGDIEVPGGVLRYRLADNAQATRTVVLENGWSASFAYLHWLERALSQRVRVLSYDRAGIGYSRNTTPLSVDGMTRQFEALLSTLGIKTPVTVIGHSYGGLIGVLHAAQSPDLVDSIVQIDPTPEFEDAIVDPSFRIVPLAARVMQACALLGLDGPLHAKVARHLPAEITARLKPNRRWSIRSLNGSIEEIRLLHAMRKVIANAGDDARCPRLVVSASPPSQAVSAFKQWIGADRKEQQFRDAAHALHRRQASLNPRSRWLALPHDHVGLIVERESATRIAEAIFEFLR